MGLIVRPETYTDGEVATAQESNDNETTLYTLVNGNIDNDNIKSAAGIVGSKINQSTLTTVPGYAPLLSKATAASPYTVLSTDQGKLINCDTSGGAVVITLISAASVASGFTIGIRNDGTANDATVNRGGSDTMGGVLTTFVLEKDQILWLTADGVSDWVPLNGIPEQRFYLEEQFGTGVNGNDDANFASGSFVTRKVNTVVYNEGNLVTDAIVSNQFKLQPGTYWLEASAPAHLCDGHVIRIRNITGSSTIKEGTSANSGFTGNTDAISLAAGRVRITAETLFEIQQKCETTRNGDGFGLAGNVGTGEIYTRVRGGRIAI